MSAERKISFLDEALAYAKRGWSVFPIMPKEKRPIGKLVPRGVLDATTDHTKIVDWWKYGVPSANIGLATGKTSGFFVLDVDPRHGGNDSLQELVRHVGRFTGTLSSRTGTGGFHYLYAMPGGPDIRNSVGQIAPGLDIRGTGGYIVAPPSIHPNGNAYEWLNEAGINPAPQELIDMIRKNAPANSSADKIKPGEMIPHGKQHIMLFNYGCTMRYAGLDEEAIFDGLWKTNITRCEIPGPEKNIRALAKSVCKYDGEGERLQDFVARVMAEVIDPAQAKAYLEDEEASEEEQREKVVAGGFTADELMQMDLPEIKWVVPGVLPEGATLLVGKPKTGKSFFALNLAVAVSCGGRALGNIKVNQGRACYLVLEGSRKGLKQRLDALLAGGPAPQLLHFYPEWPTANRGGVKRLDKWLCFHPDTELVIIDTLKMIRSDDPRNRNIYERDYNSVNPFAHMAERHDVSILIIHHTNKMPEADDPFDMASGSTGLMGAVDNGMVLRRSQKHEGVDLFVRGRDIEEIEMAMTFDSQLKTWINQGDSVEFGLNNTRQEIITSLKSLDIGEAMSPKEIAERTGQDYDLVRQTLGRMLGESLVSKKGRGMYILNPVTSVTSVTSSIKVDSNHMVKVTESDNDLNGLSLSKSSNTVQNQRISGVSDNSDRSDRGYGDTEEPPF